MAAPAQSRERLLAAGSALFSERGFAATTTRDIAKRAGVDAALIVRHFGSKVGLYLESLRAGDNGAPSDLLQTDRMLSLLGRVDAAGSGPIFQAALQAHPDQAVQAASHEALHQRIVTPLHDYFVSRGCERPQLRAELVAAAFAGIALGRVSGSFSELSRVPAADIVALVQEAFVA
jgi:AcrR family transcriptional regulator